MPYNASFQTVIDPSRNQYRISQEKIRPTLLISSTYSIILKVMRKNNRSITLLLLINMFGVLALTAPAYVSCQDDSPDEFLDLAVVSQNPILPVFDFYPDTDPLSVSLLKIFLFQRTNLHTTFLRC